MSIAKIIDKKQVETVIRRARALNVIGADFLLNRITDDLVERLLLTKRDFSRADILSPWTKNINPELENTTNVSQSFEIDLTADQIDRDEIGLAPASSDLIIDLVHLHQANDIPGTLVQYRRALRDDGLFLCCAPGGNTLFELRESLIAAEVDISGGAHPRVLPFMDVRDAGGLLQRAGFALPVTDVDSVIVRYDTMFDLMLDLRAMGATNTLSAREKSLSKRGLFQAAAEYYAKNYSDPDGRIRATFSFIWMSGWAPSATQQKPLKPGSATHRLADILRDKNA